jgi:hypothetical protein
VLKDLRACLIEMKVGINKVSVHQRERFAQLALAGCEVAVCRSVEDAIEYVTKLLGGGSVEHSRASAIESDNAPLKRSDTAGRLYWANWGGTKVVIEPGTGRGGWSFVRWATAQDVATLPRSTEAAL